MEDMHNYVLDVVIYLKERALEARSERDAANDDDRIFLSGRLMAFNEVISILQQHAEGLNIPLANLKLDDIEPDRDLV